MLLLLLLPAFLLLVLAAPRRGVRVPLTYCTFDLERAKEEVRREAEENLDMPC